MKYLILALCLTGCASQPSTTSMNSTYESPTYIRNAQGQTVAKIQHGMIYNTRGVRVGTIKK